jgi:hypothetical protein
MKRTFLILLPLALSGCFFTKKPYDTPVYVTVEPYESAYVVPLEGDVAKQVKFDSIESIEKARQLVNTRRIQVPHRWDQRGKKEYEGAWIPTITVIKVNRTPVTRSWEAPETGAKVTQATSKAIWMESKDSIGFSTGFVATAFIEDRDSSTYLYYYPSESLADVIDRDVRARIEIGAPAFAAKYDMAELRGMKAEMAAALQSDIIPFFKARGITITTVGLTGGFTYDNPDVQKAIDAVFQAQRAVEIETANATAQVQRNLAIISKAEADANAKRKDGDAIAYAIKAKFEAEASGVAAVNKALADAGNNPLVVELRRVERWNGQYPTFLLNGTAGAPNLLLNVPNAPSVP